MIINSVKGMSDLFASELKTWEFIEKTAKNTCEKYGIAEIRTPILEDLNLFVRSVGEQTDIVEKEMYVLHDKSGKDLCLRPENTASVVRALIQHGLVGPDCEQKHYYIGPMFRRERPQKGRLRQFHQFGVEIFGLNQPSVDVELMALLYDFFTSLGLSDISMSIGTLGTVSERKQFTKDLHNYFTQNKNLICADCHRRLDKNTLRILDCKNKTCNELKKDAPSPLDYLNSDSKKYFDDIQQGLGNLNIPFVIDRHLVRGLDYYTDTVFEVYANNGLGAQNAIAAGGRYNNLVENLGGKATAALGFACGIERIALLLQSMNKNIDLKGPDLMIIVADNAARLSAHNLAYQLRQNKCRVDIDHQQKSVKAQMRKANRLNAAFVLILGQNELDSKNVNIKDMKTNRQHQVCLDPDNISKVVCSSY